MQVGELCQREVVLAHRDDSLLEAARRMRDEHVGSLIVVDERPEGRIPVGVLTDRDIIVQVLGRVPEELPRLDVGDVMSYEVVSVREELTPDEAIARMRQGGVRRVPVVDARGVLVGVLALDDLIEFMAERLEEMARLIVRERQREERRLGGEPRAETE